MDGILDIAFDQPYTRANQNHEGQLVIILAITTEYYLEM
jgi:hypothetical protein